MAKVIPSKEQLKGKSNGEVKSILAAAGFRPVRAGERPEAGDIVINCNTLYNRKYCSGTSFQSGVIQRHGNEKYYVVYEHITWEHGYSRSWFERVMWIRKRELHMKEDTMHHRFMVVSDAPQGWSHDYGTITIKDRAVFTCTEEFAISGLKRLSKAYPGYDFTLTKLVARVRTPVQQEFELL